MSDPTRPLMFTLKEGDDIQTRLEPGDSIFVYHGQSPWGLYKIYRVLMFYQNDCVVHIDYGPTLQGRYTGFSPNFKSMNDYIFIIVTHPSLLSLSLVSDPPLTITGPNGPRERLGITDKENS